jgi:hypothetical protein
MNTRIPILVGEYNDFIPRHKVAEVVYKFSCS